ncbi:hypothetical protein QFZ63_002331 [Streptomyces sp. B3I7]|nr:hypothetical protein [Streptomyces sp. B3I7]
MSLSAPGVLDLAIGHLDLREYAYARPAPMITGDCADP